MECGMQHHLAVVGGGLRIAHDRVAPGDILAVKGKVYGIHQLDKAIFGWLRVQAQKQIVQRPEYGPTSLRRRLLERGAHIAAQAMLIGP